VQQDSDERYQEFDRALTDVLTEQEYFLPRRSRLVRARAAVDRNDPRYWEAVESAFSVLDAPGSDTVALDISRRPKMPNMAPT
jgi:hypothetical protein